MGDSPLLTVAEFLAWAQISRATFYRLQAAGLGPRLTRIGRLTRITIEDRDAWLKKMRDKKFVEARRSYLK